MKVISNWEEALRPDNIVAERSVNSQANIHDNYRNIFAQYGDFKISTGSVFTPQFHPWYLGMAFPFTLPLAVGGYDVPHKARWRRPEYEDIPWPRSTLPDWLQNLAENTAPLAKPAQSVFLT